MHYDGLRCQRRERSPPTIERIVGPWIILCLVVMSGVHGAWLQVSGAIAAADMLERKHVCVWAMLSGALDGRSQQGDGG